MNHYYVKTVLNGVVRAVKIDHNTTTLTQFIAHGMSILLCLHFLICRFTTSVVYVVIWTCFIIIPALQVHEVQRTEVSEQKGIALFARYIVLFQFIF